MRSSPLITGAAVLLILGLPLHAPAQEVGAHAVHATSPNPELPDPTGLALSGRFDYAGWLFGLTWVRYSDETEKPGTVCVTYSPRIDCVIESVETAVDLGGLRLAVQRSIALGSLLRLGAGGGVSFSSLSASAWGDSGRRADLSSPNTGQIGYLGILSLDVAPVPSVPLRIVGTATAHWIAFGGCADPTDKTSGYAPFCGTDRFDEWMVGLSWKLPRAFGS